MDQTVDTTININFERAPLLHSRHIRLETGDHWSVCNNAMVKILSAKVSRTIHFAPFDRLLSDFESKMMQSD